MRVGLLLEGGALRGMFTAGVMDVLLKNNIKVDGITAVSAGALFGINYFSNQKGRVIRYNRKYIKDKRYISLRSLLKTGNLVNKDFAYYEITKKLDPFNDKKFMSSNKDFYVVITNVKTGKPEYKRITSVFDSLELFRATSAIPYLAKKVKVDNEYYFDGGISDSIPIDFCQSLGYDKIIVILTQPEGYIKMPYSRTKNNMLRLKYYKYKELRKAIKYRHINYNESIQKLAKLEANGKVFVIRPSHKINIKLLNSNSSKIDDIYNLGVRDCKKYMNKLKEYLK